MRRSLCKQAAVRVLLAAALSFPATAHAKGAPDKITISGGRLAAAIEVLDREVLKGFDPWVGQFIDWSRGPAAEPSPDDRAYEVSFFMKRNGEMRRIYVIRYSASAEDRDGTVYLPGKGESAYRLNVGTILRTGQDGRWHHASAAWTALMRRLTTSAQEP